MSVKLSLEITSPLDADDRDILAGVAIMTPQEEGRQLDHAGHSVRSGDGRVGVTGRDRPEPMAPTVATLPVRRWPSTSTLVDMSPRRRPMAVALLALAATLAAAACGSGSPTEGASGRPAAPGAAGASAGPASSTPAPVSGSPARPTGPTQDATLVRVVDGDTIRVIVGGVEERVRYIGMNTPELSASSPAMPEPYAEAATDANARLLAGGRIVLESDVSDRDQYGRLLRNVWVEREGAWTFVNLALVAEGNAQVSTYPPDVKYVEVLLAAQRAARGEGLGLWGTATP